MSTSRASTAAPRALLSRAAWDAAGRGDGAGAGRLAEAARGALRWTLGRRERGHGRLWGDLAVAASLVGASFVPLSASWRRGRAREELAVRTALKAAALRPAALKPASLKLFAGAGAAEGSVKMPFFSVAILAD